MKILIAVVSSPEFLSGVTRHAANMARCLLTRPDVSEVHLVCAEWQYRSLCDAVPHNQSKLHIHSASLGKNALSRNFWYYTQLPVLAAKLQADVVHLAYPVPLNRGAFHCPVAVTLHDLYPFDIPENFGFPKVLFNRLILAQCLRVVDAIACVSESTLRRLDMHAPKYALQKAVTIYNCVESAPPVAEQCPLPNWVGERFLLCVAQHRRNKNIPLAVETFRRLLLSEDISPTTLLVIIGIEGPETARIHRAIGSLSLARQVVFMRGVSDAELQWCYAHCELLLAPSLTEGFGLPVVEAMLNHCRVVCSDIPAFREVGGSYCHYASLRDPAAETFVNAARIALKSISCRSGATDRFAGSRIAEDYLQLYGRLRSGSPVSGDVDSCGLLPCLARERGRG